MPAIHQVRVKQQISSSYSSGQSQAADQWQLFIRSESSSRSVAAIHQVRVKQQISGSYPSGQSQAADQWQLFIRSESSSRSVAAIHQVRVKQQISGSYPSGQNQAADLDTRIKNTKYFFVFCLSQNFLHKEMINHHTKYKKLIELVADK